MLGMRRFNGFTLIELLVVVIIVAVLVALAAPSFTRLVKSNSISSNVNTFLADLRFARSESIRRGGGVIMCRSNSPEAAAPACNNGSGPGGNGWVSGWFIFHDLNNDGAWNLGETILRVQAPITNVDSIAESGANPPAKFRFTATGRLLNVGNATSLQFGSNASFTNDLQRVVCVNTGGRARIAGDGTAACAGSE